MRRRLLSLTATILLTALLAAGLGVAWADEKTERTETGDPSIVVLEPGHNYVGWVAAPLSVDGLMRRIPGITSVRAWDARQQRSYTPTNLTAGMGVRISLEEGEAITWRRPTKPVRGLVTLRPGRNLVAWAGQGTTIADANRGIGSSLVRAWKPDRSSIVQRGDALWVEVSRNVNWLQPTGMLPTIKFPGGVDDEVRLRILEDLADSVAFYREEFGIEADFSTLTVYAATDVEALIDVYRKDVPDHYDVSFDFGRLRSRWDTAAGWVNDDRIVMKQRHWRDSNQATVLASGDVVWAGRAILTHEYFHIVQAQLSTIDGVLKAYDGYKYARTPQWLIEGSATWVEDAHEVYDGRVTWREANVDALNLIADAPELQYAVGNIAYDIGGAAIHLLRQSFGSAAVLDVFRLMNATDSGPNSRWRLTPSWKTAFELATGLSVDEFHAEFEAWRDRSRSKSQLEDFALHGRLVSSGIAGVVPDSPIDFQNVRIELFGTAKPGLPPAEWSDSEGQFTFYEVADGSYTLRVYFGDCFLMRDVLISDPESRRVQIAVGRDTCTYQIQGQVVGQRSVRVSGLEVSISHGSGYSTALSGEDGRFAITVPSQGSLRLRISVGNCQVGYRDGGNGGGSTADRIEVRGVDVSGVRFAVPTEMCEYRVSGNLLNSDGTPRSGEWVSASGNAGNGGGSTAADGSFSFAVPSNGSYRLSTWIDGCSIYNGSRGPTKNWNSARQIAISNSDVTGIKFRLPEDPSSFCD